MLILFAVVSLILLSGPLLLLLFWVKQFSALFPPPAASSGDGELPRAVVVLCIRGADPSLARCLEGLLAQDYPHFDLRIVIDSPEDPAWHVVRQVLAGRAATHVAVGTLEARRQTCSLKLSALVQALHDLDPAAEVVVLVDADVVPHRRWLRDLVAPLHDPAIGATTGIRWYVPDRANWGTLVRYLWNATASIVMHALQIPWGGSLAFRAEVLHRSDTLDRWAHSLFEDTGFMRILSNLGLRLQVVPAATMMNRESTDLGSCFRFIRRQLLNTRLYHGRWPVILLHGILFTLAPALALAVLLAALLLGAWSVALGLVGGLALTLLAASGSLIAVERCVQGQDRQRGASGMVSFGKILTAIPLTQAVYLASLCSATWLRTVDWRGITYEVRGPWDVRLIHYQPYRPVQGAVDRTASLV